jgi:hypothetical protein
MLKTVWLRINAPEKQKVRGFHDIAVMFRNKFVMRAPEPIGFPNVY